MQDIPSEQPKLDRSDFIEIPRATIDPNKIDLGFEVGFRPQDNEENPFDVPPEVLARNFETLNHWAGIWLMQSSMLAPLLLSDFKVDRYSGESFQDVNVDCASCNAEDKTKAIICATGPSLEKYLPALRNWKGIIIAAPTALSTLLAHDIIPHYCVAVDANPEIGAVLAEAPYAKWGVKLLVPPTCDFRTAEVFEGSRFWFKSYILARNGINHPFNLYMSLFYPWILNWVYQAGCVTNAAFLLATILNSRGNHNIQKVFLFGADFGYPEGLARIQAFKYTEKLDGSRVWIPRPRDTIESRTKRLIRTTAANGVPTDVAMLGYKRSLYSIWQMQGVGKFRINPDKPDSAIGMRPCLYSCSEGILFELPRTDGFEVLASQGENVSLYDDKLIDKAFRGYLRSSGKAEGQIVPDLVVPDEEE